MKYKLNIKRDVDIEDEDYILNLPKGYRIYDEICHVRGFDSIQEVKEFVKWGVVSCDCQECVGN